MYALLSKPSLSRWCLPLTPLVLGWGSGWEVRRGEKHTVRCIATRRDGLVRHMESLVGPFCWSGIFHIAAHILKPLQFAYQHYITDEVFEFGVFFAGAHGFGAVRECRWRSMAVMFCLPSCSKFCTSCPVSVLAHDARILWWKLWVEACWNVMAHAQKPHFVFQRNGRVHLNRLGASVQSTTGSRGVRISGSNAGYTMFRGSVKGTGYPFHSPVSPSLPLLCITVCHHISTGVYRPVMGLFYLF